MNARTNASREFRVSAPSYDPRLMIIWLLVLPELLFAIGLLVMAHRGPLPQTLQASMWVNTMFAGVIAIIFLATTALMFWAVQRRRIVLADGQLVVTSTFYRRKLPMAAIDLDNAVIVDLDANKQWRPLIKTNGIGMPGLRSGWFRSRRFVRLFCLLTTWNRVLVLPEFSGGAIVLSPERPQDLLQALRDAADASRRAS